MKQKIKDYHVTCWSCGKNTMKPKDGYFQCTGCGTTYVDLPEPGHHTLLNTWGDTFGERHWHPIGVTS